MRKAASVFMYTFSILKITHHPKDLVFLCYKIALRFRSYCQQVMHLLDLLDVTGL